MTTTIPIHLRSDALNASILPRGATLSAVRFTQRSENLVLGFADPEDHFRIPVYAGHLVGPVANRIKAGEIPLDGKIYQMTRNENGETCLHSGPDGLHTLDWDIVARTDQSATLQIDLKDGDQGLPGNRNIKATYSIAGACLTLEIAARTDQPTPMNIAAHPYWMLDGLSDVSSHLLEVRADSYVPTDSRNLPLGDIAPVAHTEFDFRTLRPVPLTPALDVNFCLAPESHTKPQSCARLAGSNGTQLEIATTAPGLQVYNGAFLPDLKGVLENGHDLKPYGGIALEPQFWPDAPHQPGFPQITLNPRDTWRQITHYRLTPPA